MNNIAAALLHTRRTAFLLILFLLPGTATAALLGCIHFRSTYVRVSGKRRKNVQSPRVLLYFRHEPVRRWPPGGATRVKPCHASRTIATSSGCKLCDKPLNLTEVFFDAKEQFCTWGQRSRVSFDCRAELVLVKLYAGLMR